MTEENLASYLPRMDGTRDKIDIIQGVCSPAIVSERVRIKFSGKRQVLQRDGQVKRSAHQGKGNQNIFYGAAQPRVNIVLFQYL